MIVLATWLWQGIAIAGVTVILLSLTRQSGAATRHAIWWVALVAVALLPLAYAVPSLVASRTVAAVADLPVAHGAVPLPAAPGGVLVALFYAWTIVSLVSFARIALSVLAVKRLKSASIPLDPARAARLRMWNSLPRGVRRPELRVSRDVRAASALGLGRPVILLATSALALDDDSLDAVVMHEDAHLARFDDWTQLAQATISAVLALHPAAWFIGRRIRLERESACDDLVVARGAAAREYARALVHLAGCTRRSPWNAVAIPGAMRSRSDLGQRVHRLLDRSRPRDARLAWPVFAACVMTMAFVVGVSARTPAFVVFVESHVPAPPVAALALRAAVYDSHGATFAVTRPAAAASPQGMPPSRPDLLPAPDIAQDAQAVSPAPAAVNAAAEPLHPVPTAQRAVPFDLAMVPAATAPVPRDQSKSPPGFADPWVAVARGVSSAGGSTASGAKAAGVSIGRFFGRAGKALAGSF